MSMDEAPAKSSAAEGRATGGRVTGGGTAGGGAAGGGTNGGGANGGGTAGGGTNGSSANGGGTAAGRAPAGRPLRADARRNRARILDVAARSFAEEGLSLSLDEIARRADVGPGTVHRHFPTKEGLLEAVVLSQVEALALSARALLDAPEPSKAFFDFCLNLAERGAANRALAQAMAAVSSSVQTSVAAAIKDMHGSLDLAFGRLQELGMVRRDTTAADLNGFLVGIHAAAERDPEDAGLPGRMMRVVCDGLRVSDGDAASGELSAANGLRASDNLGAAPSGDDRP